MQKNKIMEPSPASAEKQVTRQIEKFDPDIQKLILLVRKWLRKRFPTAHELVYDYEKVFVASYSPTERGSDGIVAISADNNGVRLALTQGVNLPDPHKILQGKASQVRYLGIDSIKTLNRPEVAALLVAAEAKLKIPLAQAGRGTIILKASKARAKTRRLKARR